MKTDLLIFGGTFGALAVMFGAFGAHALKSLLNEEQQKSFETGVRYQMYHALVLIICGFSMPFGSPSQVWMGWCFILGTFLFSFSIYGLVLSSAKGKKLKFLGPVTPVGGLFLLAGWVLFTYNMLKLGVYL
ncbi:DUF423 domain-containing protein [Antarcticibacterium flavum]|uniref:DUF423 domain-containing protein n=1 Tax=Antarcticibacterium flavum TaxID=2058175 RepID=A0A5B7X941_9FLAO|nr:MULTISPECIES: DUF423 domain-containing protein [Antarcticibacterium]MCM4160375.1 DUF423 domain-containing protein [Antarcticibacterium sp. W02-3]QCY71248.1 DUF423 domain-containing protein [Antarcticibacterium flavum]